MSQNCYDMRTIPILFASWTESSVLIASINCKSRNLTVCQNNENLCFGF